MDDEETVTIQVTRSEITTILAALREWQTTVRERQEGTVTVQDIPCHLELQFLLEPPLTSDEIDALCLRLQAARR